MASSNKNSHLTIDERRIIETGISNGSTKAAIAITLGKDKSTIGKEIKAHRHQSNKMNLPLECAKYKTCRHGRHCIASCPDYVPFKCIRRDRSPGACNGCTKYPRCRFDKYLYHAADAEHEYRESLVHSREGINATVNEIISLGELIKPLLENGQSVYVIKKNHPEITISEKTIYTYIENGVFRSVGVPISNMDLIDQVKRKVTKNRSVAFKQRRDRSYMKGRTKADYDAYMTDNPNAHIIEMDTVYNNPSGPYMQTFKFLKYDLLIIIYQTEKTTESMRNGILLLEEILGREIFEKEAEVILTDRGTEFCLGSETEIRGDGTRRTRIFYCDPMASWQKGSVENVHLLLRRICPKGCDLKTIGMNSQQKAFLAASHINSYPKEKLDGKTSFQLTRFYSPSMYEKLMQAGMTEIPASDVILKPYILK